MNWHTLTKLAASTLMLSLAVCAADTEMVSSGTASDSRQASAANAGRDDRAHLERVRDSSGPSAACDALDGMWNDVEMYQRAVDVVRAKAMTRLDELIANRDPRGLAILGDAIAKLDAGLENRAHGWSELYAAEQCAANKDWVCVAEQLSQAHDRPLPWRARKLGVQLGDQAIPALDRRATTWPRRGGLATKQARLQAMVESGEAYEKLTGTPPSTLDKARTKLAAVTERVAAKRARDAERERRRAERKAVQAERAFNREWDRATRHSSGGGSVHCCDGTTSPTCTYGGSLRGCCSHHGGVC